jgi:3-oxoacyl-[acyl-carrier protein] reductase
VTRDLLLDLAKSPLARRLSRSLKLPLTLPQPLAREAGPWRASPLEGVRVVVLGGAEAPLRRLLAELATKAGAAVGETVPGQLGALIYDATGLAAVSQLADLYEAVKGRLDRLAPCSRIVIVGRDPERATSPERAAASQALVGFVKSVGKELGRRGTTAQVVLVDDESAVGARLAGPLRFLLSRSSAFVSGQVLALSARVAALGGEPWPRPLQGKTALVTGAARGIGAAIAEKLAEEGARVTLLDRPGEEEALAALAARVGGASVAIDLADPQGAVGAIERSLSELGGLDLLVNNAGVTRDRTLGRLSRESWDQVLNVNLQAVVALSERVLESGLLREQGRVVCISSVVGIAGNAGQTNYAASKAGLIGFVRAFAPALARRGATINAVAPGVIETRMTAAMPAAVRQVARRLSALNQGGTPRDVAEAVAFLCTPGAVGLSGQTLRVCGLSFLGA